MGDTDLAKGLTNLAARIDSLKATAIGAVPVSGGTITGDVIIDGTLTVGTVDIMEQLGKVIKTGIGVNEYIELPTQRDRTTNKPARFSGEVFARELPGESGSHNKIKLVLTTKIQEPILGTVQGPEGEFVVGYEWGDVSMSGAVTPRAWFQRIFSVNSISKVQIHGELAATNARIENDLFVRNHAVSSDLRLKTDIEPIANALRTVMNTRGVTFRWNDIQGKAKQCNLGLIAQEVEQVIPAVVSTDAEGYKFINYNAIIPVLIEALKEQQRMIDDQQSSIAALRQKIDAMPPQGPAGAGA